MHLWTVVITYIAALVWPITATMYCQCENPGKGRIFPGINQICSELSDNWCSTNCNIAGYNCDYCEWIPSGASPDDDYARLKSWCSKQTGYDSASQQYYSGTDVFCYSNQQKASCSTCGGCSYNDNSFYKRSESLLDDAPPVSRREAYTGDPDREAPEASVALNVEPIEGSALARECQLLYPDSAKQMADMLAKSDTCHTEALDGDQYSVACLPTSSTLTNEITDGFTAYCDNYGGHEVDGLVAKRAAEVNVHFMS